MSIRVDFTIKMSKICIENKNFRTFYCSRYNFSCLQNHSNWHYWCCFIEGSKHNL